WTPGPTGVIAIKSRATDDSGNIESPSAGVSVTVNPRPCPCSLFAGSATPGNPSTSDTLSVELGVKFFADQGGYINGIKFYKGTGNTGTHVVSLWTSTGALIAQGTVANETASGWQTFTFPTPVAVSANTTYLASYPAPQGRYPADPRLLTRPHAARPLP